MLKYELIQKSKDYWGKPDKSGLFRLVALRDIPLYGVRAGDYGGLVPSGSTLSQYDDCWIGDGVQVTGNVFVVDNAYLGGNARVSGHSEKYSIMISGLARIYGNARVSTSHDNDAFQNMFLSEKVKIFNNAQVKDAGKLGGEASIAGSSILIGVKEVSGSSVLLGEAQVNRGVKLLGATALSGNVVVRSGSILENVRAVGNTVISANSHFVDAEFDDDGKMIFGKGDIIVEGLYDGAITPAHIANHGVPLSPALGTVALPVETKDALNLLEEIKNDLASYETDIVKIIQYPLMTDRTDNFTLEMMQALRLATRLALNPSHADFVGSVFDLEKKFLAAESHALKMASSGLNEVEMKKKDRASDLLAIASNEASSEQEKRVAFKQAFKQLEGVVMVPDMAVEAFRVKIGLKELEA